MLSNPPSSPFGLRPSLRLRRASGSERAVSDPEGKRGKCFSFLWKMVRRAHDPEPVEGGRWGGILKSLFQTAKLLQRNENIRLNIENQTLQS